MKHPMPQIGDCFGCLTVVNGPMEHPTKHSTYGRKRRDIFRVKCDNCGHQYLIQKHSLVTVIRSHCNNCLGVGLVPEGHRNRLYMKLSNAIRRCTDLNHKKFPRYGGRGIRVHQAWVDNKLEFYRYIMTLPGWNDPTLVLDRVNNDGHYEPGNLRFVTHEESIWNSTSTIGQNYR